jgi:tRNA G18 (ribose-2'-O)-methylase SpoU
MGTHFTHTALMTTWAAFEAWATANGVAVWGADARGEPLSGIAAAAPAKLAIVVGNEGAGLTAQGRARAERLVGLPAAGVDSLNVAVAAGILLYELRQ